MSRIDLFTPIHKALRSMIYELGKEIQTNDFTDVHATEVLVARLKHDLASASATCILCLLHEHAGYEDRSIFPEVRTFDSQMVETLMHEHGEIVRRMHILWKLADELIPLRDRDQRIEMGDKLYRSANDLFAYYLTHLNKEEATILPATWKYFTDEQLAAIRANVQKNIPPERIAEWTKWMLPSLNMVELTDMFLGLKQQAPPPVFENMTHLAQQVLGEDRWGAVKANAGL